MSIRAKAVVLAAAVVAGAGATALSIAATTPASASPLSGTYVLSDLGQGCHVAGTLNGSGSITSIGGCLVLPDSAPGGGIQVFTGGTWSGSKSSGVTICFTFKVISGPQYPTPFCVGPLPVNTGPEVIPDPGGGTTKTFIDISLH